METQDDQSLFNERIVPVFLDGAWAGAYWSPYCRAWAVVTEEYPTIDQAGEAARAWLRGGIEDLERRAAGMPTWLHFWRPDPTRRGFMAPYRQNLLGEVFLDRECGQAS